MDVFGAGLLFALATVFVLALTEKVARLIDGTASLHPVLLANKGLIPVRSWVLGVAAAADSLAVAWLLGSPRIGASIAAILVMAYTAAGVRSVGRGRSLGCSCTGVGALDANSASALVARNLLILALAIYVALTVPPRAPSWGAFGVVAGVMVLLSVLARRIWTSNIQAPAREDFAEARTGEGEE